jgi:hypothetical protein
VFSTQLRRFTQVHLKGASMMTISHIVSFPAIEKMKKLFMLFVVLVVLCLMMFIGEIVILLMILIDRLV